MIILRKDTVDAIVSDFSKVVGRLRACAVANQEATRAKTIADKIEGLLS